MMFRILWSLGWWSGHLLLYPITLYYFLTSPSARVASRDYLRRVLGRAVTNGDVLRHIFVFASVILDRAFLLSGRRAGYHIEVQGLDVVSRIVERGQGCVLLGAHIGSFDVLRDVGRNAPVRVRPLMYRARGAIMTGMLEALDPVLAADIIEIGRPDTMLRVQESVASGEIVGILADRAPGENDIVTVPFLGGTASLPTGPFLLASLLKVPVVLFSGILTGPRRYSVAFEPFADPLVLRRGMRQEDLAKTAERFAAWMAATCRDHPYNWFNFYRFWESSRDATQTRNERGALKWLLPALMTTLLAAGPAVSQTPQSEGWFADLMQRLAAIPERQCSFHEEKRLAALDRPLVSEGRLVYLRPSHLEKITTAPEPESVIVDGDRLQLSAEGEPAQRFSLSARPELAALVDAVRGTLSGDTAMLERHYRLQAAGSLSGWSVQLRPIDAAVATMVHAITVDGVFTHVATVRTEFPNGDVTIMSIEDAR
ncbi:MAG TPA: LolA-related protein [Acetobacteraceae bacterium]|nr:LolA-related protein [Acetobacteraceae bacterium]